MAAAFGVLARRSFPSFTTVARVTEGLLKLRQAAALQRLRQSDYAQASVKKFPAWPLSTANVALLSERWEWPSS
jgi:hypothetical protein